RLPRRTGRGELPARGRIGAVRIAQPQTAARRAHEAGHDAHDPLVDRRVVGLRERPRELLPLRAIVVAIGEEVFRDGHLRPGAELLRECRHRQGQRAGGEEENLPRRAPRASELTHVIAAHRHDEHVEGGPEERRIEEDDPRGEKGGRLPARDPSQRDGQQHRRECIDEAACLPEVLRGAAVQHRHGVEGDVPGIERADREPEVLQVPALRGAGVAHDLLDEDEPRDREHERAPDPIALEVLHERHRLAGESEGHDRQQEDRDQCAHPALRGLCHSHMARSTETAQQDERPRELAQVLRRHEHPDSHRDAGALSGQGERPGELDAQGSGQRGAGQPAPPHGEAGGQKQAVGPRGNEIAEHGAILLQAALLTPKCEGCLRPSLEPVAMAIYHPGSVPRTNSQLWDRRRIVRCRSAATSGREEIMMGARSPMIPGCTWKAVAHCAAWGVLLALTGCGGGGGGSGGGGGGGGTMSYTLGGTVTGLGNNTGLVLANGSTTLDVPAGATTFTFAAAIASGTAYSVSVQTSPSGLDCKVASGGSGTISAKVTNVMVACTAQSYTLGGTITGLGSASGLVLSNEGG